jgi:hypothetical protein
MATLLYYATTSIARYDTSYYGATSIRRFHLCRHFLGLRRCESPPLTQVPRVAERSLYRCLECAQTDRPPAFPHLSEQ